jgi:endonuclease/exonuclease/phosphatase family metal-dependent hydrolase
MTPEHEAELQRLEIEIQIAEKRLRLVQVRKQIAETELDIIGLQATLRQQIGEGTPLRAY